MNSTGKTCFVEKLILNSFFDESVNDKFIFYDRELSDRITTEGIEQVKKLQTKVGNYCALEHNQPRKLGGR